MKRTIRDISDTTIIIPVRIDSIDRLENLRFVTDFLLSTFKTNIYVLEIDARNNKMLKKLLNKKIKYDFHKDLDSVFYRTKYINKMVNKVNTPYIAIWDADVLVRSEQIYTAISHLRQDKTDFVYPYDGTMLNVPSCVKNIFYETSSFDTLDKFSSGFRAMYGSAIGGAFLANTKKYIESGMENENFYGWGLEDGERFLRWQKLGYRIDQIEGKLYHLDHSRGGNSHFHNKTQKSFKWREKIRIGNQNKDLLKQEISNWHSDFSR